MKYLKIYEKFIESIEKIEETETEVISIKNWNVY